MSTLFGVLDAWSPIHVLKFDDILSEARNAAWKEPQDRSTRSRQSIARAHYAKRVMDATVQHPWLFYGELYKGLRKIPANQRSTYESAIAFFESLDPEAVSRGDFDKATAHKLSRRSGAMFQDQLRVLARVPDPAPDVRYVPCVSAGFWPEGRDAGRVIAIPASLEDVVKRSQEMSRVLRGSGFQDELFAILLQATSPGLRLIDPEEWCVRYECALYGVQTSHDADECIHLLTFETRDLFTRETFLLYPSPNPYEDGFIENSDPERKAVENWLARVSSFAKQIKAPYLHLTSKRCTEAANDYLSSDTLLRCSDLLHRTPDPKPIDAPAEMTTIDLCAAHNGTLAIPGDIADRVTKTIATLLRAAPRELPQGKKLYHKHRASYDAWPRGSTPLPESAIGILMDIVRDGASPKEYRATILEAFDTLHTLQQFMDRAVGKTWDAPLAELLSSQSRADNSQVIIQRASPYLFVPDLLAGYAGGNCLTMKEVIEFKRQPGASMDFLWWEGKRIGVSYGLSVPFIDRGVLPLVDSLEIVGAMDDALDAYVAIDGQPVALYERIVDGYLEHRLSTSPHGLLIHPDSNRTDIADRMESFAREHNGHRLMGGKRMLHSDTGLNDVPWFVPPQ